MAGDAHGLSHEKLRVGGAVATAALLLEDLKDVGIGSCLHGKVFPEAGVPGKSRL